MKLFFVTYIIIHYMNKKEKKFKIKNSLTHLKYKYGFPVIQLQKIVYLDGLDMSENMCHIPRQIIYLFKINSD